MLNIKKQLINFNKTKIETQLINASVENTYNQVKKKLTFSKCESKEHPSKGNVTIKSNFKKETEIKLDSFCCQEFENKCIKLIQ